MQIVLTNDDGIDAPGLAALQQALTLIPRPSSPLVVAPAKPHSGCSHQMNRGQPIALEARASNAYAVSGTPADCTRVALTHLMPKPQWILSGINAGGNLGSDIYVSGTVAAVREATLLRIPAIAISQYIHQKEAIDWQWTAQQTARVLQQLMNQPATAGRFWNINLPTPSLSPEIPDIVTCPLCTQPLPTAFTVIDDHYRYTGSYRDRQRDTGADVDVCFSGQISVTEVRLW